MLTKSIYLVRNGLNLIQLKKYSLSRKTKWGRPLNYQFLVNRKMQNRGEPQDTKISFGIDRFFLPILYKTLKISKGSLFPFTLIDGNFLMAKFFVREALVVALIRMSALDFLVKP